MRGVYKSRREALVEALARYAPNVAVTGLAAGCHAVLRLPAGVTEEDAVAGCAASSVAVYGMSRYRSDRRTEPAELVLGFGNVKGSAIVDAMRRVGPILRGR
jgi:GntR family transcriptional regulator/MocR family aminotransferase